MSATGAALPAKLLLGEGLPSLLYHVQHAGQCAANSAASVQFPGLWYNQALKAAL
jgi:hypothetical protein